MVVYIIAQLTTAVLPCTFTVRVEEPVSVWRWKVLRYNTHSMQKGWLKGRWGLWRDSPCRHLTVYLQIIWYVYARCITPSPFTHNL